MIVKIINILFVLINNNIKSYNGYMDYYEKIF